jgi:TRAP-type C4-dicarboxylate transport system permease small subunit
VNRLFHSLLAGLNTLASVWVLFIVGLVSADVIGRAAFNAPLSGVPEIVRFSIVGMVWLQMAYTLRSGNHLRTTLFLGAMPPLAQRAVLAANSLVGVGLFVLIAWLGWIEMAKSFEIGAFEGEHPVRIPVGPVWAILVGGAALTALQFALDAVRYVRQGPRRSELSDVEDASAPAP